MTANKERVKFSSGGHYLIGIKEIPKRIPAPGVILFHGLGNSKEDCPLSNEVSNALLKNGLITFRFDFFGSGESPGMFREKTLSILEKNARDAIDYLSEDNRVTEIGAWGRSSGGTIIALCGDDSRIKASVMLSTPVLLQKTFGEKFKELARREREEGVVLPGSSPKGVKGQFELTDAWFNELPKLELKIQKNLRKMKRVLVIGTTPDCKVSLDNSTTIVNIVKEPKKIYVFENTDHSYEGKEEVAVSLVVEWFNRYLKGNRV